MIAGFERLKPGPGKSQESVATHQRTRIHRAMVELTAEGGRRGITVRQLAKLAGVSTESFYAHFDGVDDCLLSACSSLVDGVSERILARRSFRAPRQTQGERIARALFEGLTADPRAGRMALIEAFAGGPAALGVVTAQETSLELALQASLSRRGERVSTTAVSWISAGVLHAARSWLSETGAARTRSAMVKPLGEWAGSCLVEPEAPLIGAPAVPASRPGWIDGCGSQGDLRGEAAVLRSAVQRLALKNGYWGLSASSISQVAGVPKTHFKRHFSDLDDAYLDGVDDLARRLFEPLMTSVESRNWTEAVCIQVGAVVDRAAGAEAVAHLALGQISAPGIRGVTRKQMLIDDLASEWNSLLPSMGQTSGDRTRTAVAGLWAALSRMAATGGPRLRNETASTSAYLVLAPVVGGEAASATVRRAT